MKPFTTQFHVQMTLSKKGIKNIVEKGENAGSRHFPNVLSHIKDKSHEFVCMVQVNM